MIQNKSIISLLSLRNAVHKLSNFAGWRPRRVFQFKSISGTVRKRPGAAPNDSRSSWKQH